MVKYETVMNGIMEKIGSGEWSEGMLMPTEHELCEIYGVSRITVRRALDELERRGAVTRQQGKGTFVKVMETPGDPRPKGFKHTMEKYGIEVESRLITRERMKAPEDIREKLRLPSAESRVWHFIRIRKADGTPVAYMETYVSEELGNIMIGSDLSEVSFYDLYREIFGSPVNTTSGFITAVNAEARMAKHLGLPEGAALLLFRSVAFLEDGRPVQVDLSYLDPQNYRFPYELHDA